MHSVELLLQCGGSLHTRLPGTTALYPSGHTKTHSSKYCTPLHSSTPIRGVSCKKGEISIHYVQISILHTRGLHSNITQVALLLYAWPGGQETRQLGASPFQEPSSRQVSSTFPNTAYPSSQRNVHFSDGMCPSHVTTPLSMCSNWGHNIVDSFKTPSYSNGSKVLGGNVSLDRRAPAEKQPVTEQQI